MSKWAKNDWRWLGGKIVEACLHEMQARNKQALYFAGDEQENYFENQILHKLIAAFAPQTIRTTHLSNTDSFYERNLCCSTLSRERFLIRDYSKTKYFQWDFLPFCYWYKSELVELAKVFCEEQFVQQYLNEENLILNEESFSYKNLEWAYKEDDVTWIIDALTPPQQYSKWHSYTANQQKLLARLWALEKETRWKIQPPHRLNLNINR